MKRIYKLFSLILVTLFVLLASCTQTSGNQYTVTFLNEDGTKLQEVKVNPGETAVYTAATPTKESSDPDFYYEFTGWSSSTKNVQQNLSVTAVYKARINSTAVRTKYTNETKLTQVVSSSSKLDVDYVAEATVSSYVDGDTTFFWVSMSNGRQKISVRYLGIDTPESTYKVEAWGIKAAQFTKSKLEQAKNNGGKIVLQAEEGNLKDGNERYLCWVWYQPSAGEDFRLLNLEIIEEAYSDAKSYLDTQYEETFRLANARSQAFGDRMWGEKDPTFDYNKDGVKMTIKQILDTYATKEAIEQEKDKGKKVYVEGTVVRKVGISSAYIEQVDNGYVTYDSEGNEVVVEGDGLTYGIYLYGGYNEVTKFDEVGTVIYTNANISYHYGSIQLVGVSNTSVALLEEERVEVTPVQLDGSMWTAANQGQYKYRLVEFKNLTVTGGKDDDDSDSYDIYTVTEDGTVVNLRVDQNTTIRINGKKNKTWTAFEGKTFESVVGIVATFQPYNGAQVIYQILITQNSDISYN